MLSNAATNSLKIRKSPILYNYYGIPLWIRGEQHNGIWSHITVSFHKQPRSNQRAKRGKCVLRKRYVLAHDIQLLSSEPIPNDVIAKTLKKVLPRYVLPELFEDRHLDKSGDMPFGLLAPYAYCHSIIHEAVSAKYQCDRQKAMDHMLELWGEQPLHNITPEFCGADLLNMPISLANDCVRLLRRLWALELGTLVTDPQVWDRYDTSAFHAPYSPTRAIRTSLINLPLPPIYRSMAISRCLIDMDDPRFSNYYLVALALLTQPLTPGEGCALLVGSLQAIIDYPSHYQLRIDHEIRRRGAGTGHRERAKQYVRVPITAQHRCRLLATSNLLGMAWQNYIKRHPTLTNDSLLLTHPKNKNRVMPVKYFQQWLADTFGDLLPADIKSCDQKISVTYDVAQLMFATATEMLSISGYTDAELRYQQGRPPHTMAARHYAGYDAPTVQAKMGALQDALHIQFFDSNPPVQKRRQHIARGQAQYTMVVRYWVTIPPGTDISNFVIKTTAQYSQNITGIVLPYKDRKEDRKNEKQD